VTPKRIALRLLLVAIAVSSLLGIVGIVGGRFNETGVKCLVTALMVGGGCLVALACIAAWEKPGALVVSRLGVIATAVAVVLGCYSLWTNNNHDWLMKLIAAVVVIGVASAHASTMWLTRLPPSLQGLRTTTLATSVLLVMVLLGTLWSEPRGDGAYQVIAVLSIIAAALTVAVAAVSAGTRASAGPHSGSADVCFCTRCGKSLWEPAGEIRCRHCDERFLVELRSASELPDAVLRS
jgi:DNA-directed RNA polymerase subunit RPC12/RpoP